MKKGFFSTLIIMSFCSHMLAGCGSITPTSEPVNTETTVTVESEETTAPENQPETTEEQKETEVVETMVTETQPEETETVETSEIETQTEEAETTQTAEAETQIEEPKTEESIVYTFTDVEAIKYAKKSVSVRSLPDKTGDKLGGLNTNDEVQITGQCNETGWFRFEYKGALAYVSNSYLVDEKVAVEQGPAQSTSNDGSSSEACPYPLNVWTQSTSADGYPIFIIYSTLNVDTGVLQTYRSIFEGGQYGSGIIYDTCMLYNDLGLHGSYVSSKVGTFAEGTIYQTIAGAHYYPMNTRCPGGCAPGKYN